jgi:hypothetical protein
MLGQMLMLALDREQQMIAALISVIVASVFVSASAWTLLWRERRARRASPRERDPSDDGGA